MKIEILIPSLAELFQNGCPVQLALKGKSWFKSQLGNYAKEKGIYILYHQGVVKYIGKTDGPSMSFGMRLRREFQESASQGKHIYPKLAQLSSEYPIMAYFLTLSDVKKHILVSGGILTNENLNVIFEQVLIQVYKPEFQ